MKVELAKGRYIVAVSGGVDSMVLLSLLIKVPDVSVVVAHLNHGIRSDASKDDALVKKVAKKAGLPFVRRQVKLGSRPSEAAARQARYTFLEDIRQKYGCRAIITAHHQDDLIETAILNLLRGSGRRGLVALAINPKVIRPLLAYSKTEILAYAKSHKIKWREDSTNADQTYLRNYVRHQIIPSLQPTQRQQLISYIDKVAKLEKTLDPLIATLSQKIIKDQTIDRQLFTSLQTDLGNELLLHWLRQQPIAQPQKSTIQRLSVALRSAKPQTTHPISDGLDLYLSSHYAQLVTPYEQVTKGLL